MNWTPSLAAPEVVTWYFRYSQCPVMNISSNDKFCMFWCAFYVTLLSDIFCKDLMPFRPTMSQLPALPSALERYDGGGGLQYTPRSERSASRLDVLEGRLNQQVSDRGDLSPWWYVQNKNKKKFCSIISWSPLKYVIRHLVRSRDVSKPRDWSLDLLYRFAIWQGLCNGADGMAAMFKSDPTILNTNLATSILCEILSEDFIYGWPIFKWVTGTLHSKITFILAGADAVHLRWHLLNMNVINWKDF